MCPPSDRNISVSIALFGRHGRGNVFNAAEPRHLHLSFASLFAITAAFAVVMASPVHAATSTYWTLTDQAGDWFDSSNWNNGVPNSNVTANIVNGGTTTVTSAGAVCNALLVGNTSCTGTMQLAGNGSLAATNEYVGTCRGTTGTGTFIQSGGTNSLSGTLYVGGYVDWSDLPSGAANVGTYYLSGDGLLSVQSIEYIGCVGTGLFFHSAGTNTTDTLYLGLPSSSGTYTLSGSGVLTASTEWIGYIGSGTGTRVLSQSGGTNNVTYMKIASCGTYRLLAGALNLTAGLANNGTLDLSNSSASIRASSAIVDLSNATLSNSQNLALTLDSHSLLIVPAGMDAEHYFTNYYNAGLVLQAGSTVTIASNRSISGAGTISGHVNCQGTIATSSIFGISINGGITASSSSKIDLGNYATVVVNDTSSEISGGQIRTGSQYIGKSGIGAVTQSAGTSTVATGSLYLGYEVGDSGTYSLSGSGYIYVFEEYLGYNGAGCFLQSGGTHSTNDFYLGYGTCSTATYNLSGDGLLSTSSEYLRGGTVTFTQSGGTNSVRGLDFIVGKDAGGAASYSLNAGTLTCCGDEDIRACGTFIQSGGVNRTNTTYTGQLIVAGSYTLNGDGLLTSPIEIIRGTFAQSAGTNSIVDRWSYYHGLRIDTGSYFLSQTGQLSAGCQYLGLGGTGTCVQSGGTNTAGTLCLGYGSGAKGIYNLNGGVLILGSMSYGSGTGTFNFGGGTLTADTALSISLPMTLTGNGGNANLDTAGFAGTLSGALSGPGGLNKFGDNSLTLAGANTYTGDTNVNGGKLILSDAGSLILLVDDATNSRMTVATGAELDLNGTLKLDIDDVWASAGTWTLIDNDGTTAYGSSFALMTTDGASFTQNNDIWTYLTASQQWTFTEATGTLSLIAVPEPSAIVLLAVLLACLAWYGRRLG